jgi:hypothetical protein
VAADQQKLRRQIERVTAKLRDEAQGSRTLGEQLLELEAEQDRLAERRERLSRRSDQEAVRLPAMPEIKEEMRRVLETLPADPRLCERLRELVPTLEVVPVRLCDGGAVVLRARVVLDLVPLVPEACRVGELGDVLRRELTVDLFDPPQREEFRQRVMALRAQGLTEREAAARLKIRVSAAQKAAALQRLMDERGLTDPYEPVTSPPADCTRMRRHLHERYRFDPLPGYPHH